MKRFVLGTTACPLISVLKRLRQEDYESQASHWATYWNSVTNKQPIKPKREQGDGLMGRRHHPTNTGRKSGEVMCIQDQWNQGLRTEISEAMSWNKSSSFKLFLLCHSEENSDMVRNKDISTGEGWSYFPGALSQEAFGGFTTLTQGRGNYWKPGNNSDRREKQNPQHDSERAILG